MDLKALQETLRAFASERDWEQYHTPKNLAMALMVEAAELMELFQWKTPEQSFAAKRDKCLQSRIGEESADVLLYLLQLVDHTGVDLEYAVHDKLLKNAKKHAVPDTQDVSGRQDLKLVQTHVLIDWENVQPKDSDNRGASGAAGMPPKDFDGPQSIDGLEPIVGRGLDRVYRQASFWSFQSFHFRWVGR